MKRTNGKIKRKSKKKRINTKIRKKIIKKEQIQSQR